MDTVLNNPLLATIHAKQLALCNEIEAVVELSNQAQASVSDDIQFMRQISLLFNRIHNLDALRREASLCTLEELESLTRNSGCVSCEE